MHCCLCSFDRSLPRLIAIFCVLVFLNHSTPLFFFWWANRLTRPRHLSAQLTSAVAPALQALSHSLSLPSLSCSGAVLRNRQCAATCPVQSPPQREESHSRRFVSTPYLTSLLRYT